MAKRKTPDTFAARLLSLRQQAGLSQQALGDAAGVNRSYIAKLEGGKMQPSLATAQVLAKALGVSVATFDGCA